MTESRQVEVSSPGEEEPHLTGDHAAEHTNLKLSQQKLDRFLMIQQDSPVEVIPVFKVT